MTQGHVVDDLAQVTPVTESHEYSQCGEARQFGDENFDDMLSSFCNDFSS